MKRNLELEFIKILDQCFIKKNDIYYLLKFIINKNYFFDLIIKNKIQKLKEILKNMFLEVINDNEIIFYEGDISTEFYIILKGNIDIYKNFNNLEDLKKLKETNKSEYKKFILKNYSQSFYQKFKNNKLLFNKDLENFNCIKVVSLNEGENFGELAIINGEKRKASVIAKIKNDLYNENKYEKYKYDYEFKYFENLINNKFKNKIIFGCLNKEIFKKFMKNEFIEEQDKKIFRFKKIFKNIYYTENFIRILPYFHKKEYTYKSLICKKNDDFNKILLIDEGKVEWIDFIKVNKIYNNSNKLNYNENYLNYLKLKLKKEIYNNNKNFEISVRYLNENEFIGLHELSNNLKKFVFSAKVLSKKLIVYEITLENALFLNNNYLDFIEIFKKHFINFKEYIIRKNTLILQWKKNINVVNINNNYNLNSSSSINIKNERICKNKINNKIISIYLKKKKSLLSKNNTLINSDLKNIISKIKTKKEIQLFNKNKTWRFNNFTKESNLLDKTKNFLNSINSNIVIKKSNKEFFKNKKFKSKLNLKLKKKFVKSVDKKKNKQSLGIKNSNINKFKNYFYKNKFSSIDKIKNKLIK